MVNAIILCGGKQTRLLSLSPDLPKTLLRVHGKSIIGRLIEGLGPKVSSFHISHASKSDLLQKAVENDVSQDNYAKLKFSFDSKQLGTAAAIQQIEIDEPTNIVIIINGDTCYSEYSELFDENLAGTSASISCSYQKINNAGEISVTEQSKLEIKKNRFLKIDSYGWVSNGIIALSQECFQFIQHTKLVEISDLENFLFSYQDQPITLRTFKSNAQFIDVGTPDTFKNADKYFEQLIRDATQN